MAYAYDIENSSSPLVRYLGGSFTPKRNKKREKRLKKEISEREIHYSEPKQKFKSEEEIRKDERMKVYEEIIQVCEKQKASLMNLSIPMRSDSIKAYNIVISYCCNHETEEEDES